MPVAPEQTLTKISERELSVLFENTEYSQINKARLNFFRNVLTVDVVNYAAVEAPIKVTTICGVPLRPHVPRGRNTTVGVISGVDGDKSDKYLIKEISASEKVFHVHHSCTSNCVKVVFTGVL